MCCRQIEELTQYINKTELKINEILDENEELRYRLSMDPRAPLDLTEFRKNKAIRHEEEKALNFILQRQVRESTTTVYVTTAVLVMNAKEKHEITICVCYGFFILSIMTYNTATLWRTVVISITHGEICFVFLCLV